MNRSALMIPAISLLWTLFGAAAAGADEAPLRAQAVIDLSFNEPEGDARDAAAAGGVQDSGRLQNGATRVASPFWNHERGRAVLLDAAQKQFVEIADGADTDRPRAATVAFFFLNLVPPDTEAFAGLFAKRSEERGNVTNYGVNFGMKNGTLQLYVNDGSGYRIARFSVADTIGYRRRVHVAATFEVSRRGADAGANGDDRQPPGDLRMRLFINGRIVKPAGGGPGVTIDGNDAWVGGIDAAKIANDVPLTLGATNAQREFASGLFDEFVLFGRALSSEEVERLFLEVAGDNARQLADAEMKGAARPAPPKITGLSPRGAQLGRTTRIEVTGTGLVPTPYVSLSDSRADVTIVDGSMAERLLLDVTLPQYAPSGFVPLRVQTEAGLSNAVPLAIDTLPPRLAAGSSMEQPSELPGAFTGTSSGSERPRIWFNGKKGDRVAAEVEARRIGALFDPVLELKTERGRPLQIAGGSIPLRGDARIEVNLPADGLYYVELHDLQYRAPANSPFRLLVGDIALFDGFVPGEVEAGRETLLRAVGSGLEEVPAIRIPPLTRGSGEFSLVKLPEDLRPAGPAPPVRTADGSVFAEPVPPRDAPVPVPMPERGARTQSIHGNLTTAGEEDYYFFETTPGAKLVFTLATRSIGSPMHGLFTVMSAADARQLADTSGQPDNPEPKLELTVPDGVTHLLLAIRDRHGRGDPSYRYRLDVKPAAWPNFKVRVLEPQLVVPADGRAIIPVLIEPRGYSGAVQLTVRTDVGDGNEPSPAATTTRVEIAPGNQSRKVLLPFTASPLPGGRTVFARVAAVSGDRHEALHLAVVEPDPGSPVIAGSENHLPIAISSAAGLQVDVPGAGTAPPAFARGETVEIPVHLNRSDAAANQTVRLSLITNEPERPVDPRDPRKGMKPRIEALPGQVVLPGETEAVLRVRVPEDVEVKEIQWAVPAELVPHAWSDDVRATIYSLPVESKVESRP